MGLITSRPLHQLFVSWTTVRILLILSVILRLDTKQVDYTCAFLYVTITKDVQLFCFKTRCPSLEFSSISTSKTITFGTNIWFLHSKLYSPSGLHVWGCPTFVFDPRLQDGKKLPKWSPRSCLGFFMGYSNSRSSAVSLILNLKTGSITPRYHLVHDDRFSTVSNSNSLTLPE